mgnify:CR=1 FL=1
MELLKSLEEPHAIPVNEIALALGTDLNKGLSIREAEKRLKIFGYNEIVARKVKTALHIFLNQFNDIFVIILLVAILIAIFVERSIVDSVVIGLIVLVNAIVGFFQEYKAEKALEVLKEMISPMAKVIRDGKYMEIPARLLVPGDIILLEEGDRVPADARLFESINLQVEESILTGESIPVEKYSDIILPRDTPIAERKNVVFSGTHVITGRGKGIVIATGMRTEFGKIAEMVQEIEEKETPLKRKLETFGRKMAAVVLILATLIFVLEWIRSGIIVESFIIAIALAVAVVPEGLPAIVTITLALGARELAKRNAIIRRLSSAETLGSTTVICSDKTGTITKGEMTVRYVYINNRLLDVSMLGNKIEFYTQNGMRVEIDKIPLLENLLLFGALCTNVKISDDKIIGDPTEKAIVIAALKAGMSKLKLDNDYPRVGEIPFSSARKRMTTIHIFKRNDSDMKIAIMKGAPEVVIEKCQKIITIDGEIYLTDEIRNLILENINDLAKRGLRVLAVAYRNLPEDLKDYDEEIVERDMTFLGLFAFIDPPRDEVYPAVTKAQKAGIKIVMITGDHKSTAETIARDIGILHKDDIVLTGNELDKLSDDEYEKIVERITVYARVSPGHKLRIVETLQKKGHIVAMTGDGVNDAPAVKKADIGIAMGISGTDVTKEAADMILTDDNFATIITATEWGRIIYNNIRKFVRYLLSVNFAELLLIAIPALIGLPIPLLPAMILWINLITDGPPAIALGIDPPHEDVMSKPPRDPKEGLLHGMVLYILAATLFMTSLGLLIFYYALSVMNAHINKARTMVFLFVALFELFVIWNSRSEEKSIFRLKLTDNPYLLISVMIALLTTVSLPYIPFVARAFHLSPLSLNDWLIILPAAATGLLVLPEIFMRKRIWKFY